MRIKIDHFFIRNLFINQLYRFFEAVNSIRKSFKMEVPEIETESFDELNTPNINVQNFSASKKRKKYGQNYINLQHLHLFLIFFLACK